MRIAPIFVLAVTFSCAAQKTPSQINPEEVLKHIAKAGATQTIQDFYDKPPWLQITKGIASGDTEWLQVYSSLEPSADAGAAEDLNEAIFGALPKGPLKVLPLLTASRHLSAEQVCTFTFESSVPPGGIDKYLTHLETALLEARTEQERQLAVSCKRGIAATRSAFRQSPDY